MQGRYLETMTWQEAEEALSSFPVLMLPLGARTKEHGHHLPLNNDWVMAEYLTKRVMVEFPALVLPTIQYSHYPAFLEYPGSVNISEKNSQGMILDIIESFTRHDCKNFYVLNTGISTVRVLKAIKQELYKQAVVFDYTHLGLALKDVESQLQEQEGGTHADEFETSMMLYMAPEIVRMERAVKDYHVEQKPGPLRRHGPVENGVYSPTGAWGDPTLASREKGKILTETLVQVILKDLSQFLVE
jgi:creatinine amidohydrolase